MTSPPDMEGFLQELERKFQVFDKTHDTSERHGSTDVPLEIFYDYEATVDSIKENVDHSNMLRSNDKAEHGSYFAGPDRKFTAWVKSQLNVAEQDLPAPRRAAVQREVSLGFRFDVNFTSPPTVAPSVVVRRTHVPFISSTPTFERDKRGVRARDATQPKVFPADMSPVICASFKLARSHDALNSEFDDVFVPKAIPNVTGISLPDLTDENALNADNVRSPPEHSEYGHDAFATNYISLPLSAMPSADVDGGSETSGDQPKNNTRFGRRSTFSVFPDASQIIQLYKHGVEAAAVSSHSESVPSHPSASSAQPQACQSKRPSRRTCCIQPGGAGLNETFTNEDFNQTMQTSREGPATSEMERGDHVASHVAVPHKNAHARKSMTFNSHDHGGDAGKLRSATSSQNSSTTDVYNQQQQNINLQNVNRRGNLHGPPAAAPQIVKRGVGVRPPLTLHLPLRNMSAMPNSISTNSVNSVGSGSTSSLSSINNPSMPFNSGLPFVQQGSRMLRPAVLPQPSTSASPSPRLVASPIASPRLAPSGIMPPSVADLNRSGLPARGGLRPPTAIKKV